MAVVSLTELMLDMTGVADVWVDIGVALAVTNTVLAKAGPLPMIQKINVKRERHMPRAHKLVAEFFSIFLILFSSCFVL